MINIQTSGDVMRFVAQNYPTLVPLIYNMSARRASLEVLSRIMSERNISEVYDVGKTFRRIRMPKDFYSNTPIKPKFYINKFARESMRALSGGALRFVHEAEKYIRIDGGAYNIHNYLTRYSEAASGPDCSRYFNLNDLIHVTHELFGDNVNNTVLPLDVLRDEYTINVNASGGCVTARDLFSKSACRRLELLDLMMPLLEHQHMKWRNTPSIIGTGSFDILWSVSTRGKLIPYDTALSSLGSGKPLCRVISIADPCEHYLGYPAYKPIMDNIMSNINGEPECWRPITIGIRKNSYHWPALAKHLMQYQYTFCCDWSRFDTTITPSLLLIGIRVLMNYFSTDDVQTNNYVSNLITFMKNNIITSKYIYDNVLYDTQGGIPSGSLWTSILGSVINYVVLRTLFNKLRDKFKFINEFKIFVYGDDAVVGFNKCNDVPKLHTKRVIRLISSLAKRIFGMNLSQEDARICFNGQYFKVGVVIPVYENYDEIRLRAGTRGLMPTRTIEQEYPIYEHDYKRGITHRWYYNFRGRPSFLKRYWDPYCRPIASAEYTMTRLINTETECNSITKYKDLLLSMVQDNIHNHHVVNYGFHLYHDIDHLSYMYDHGKKKMREEFTLLDTHGKYNEYITSIPFEMPEERDMSKMERYWYRRVENYVDLRTHWSTKYVYREYKEALIKRTGWSDIDIEDPGVTSRTYGPRDVYIDKYAYERQHANEIRRPKRTTKTFVSAITHMLNELGKTRITRGHAPREYLKLRRRYHVMCDVLKVMNVDNSRVRRSPDLLSALFGPRYGKAMKFYQENKVNERVTLCANYSRDNDMVFINFDEPGEVLNENYGDMFSVLIKEMMFQQTQEFDDDDTYDNVLIRGLRVQENIADMADELKAGKIGKDEARRRIHDLLCVLKLERKCVCVFNSYVGKRVFDEFISKTDPYVHNKYARYK